MNPGDRIRDRKRGELEVLEVHNQLVKVQDARGNDFWMKAADLEPRAVKPAGTHRAQPVTSVVNPEQEAEFVRALRGSVYSLRVVLHNDTMIEKAKEEYRLWTGGEELGDEYITVSGTVKESFRNTVNWRLKWGLKPGMSVPFRMVQQVETGGIRYISMFSEQVVIIDENKAILQWRTAIERLVRLGLRTHPAKKEA